MSADAKPIATVDISADGWVGSVDDLTAFLGVFRELQEVLREKASLRLAATEDRRRSDVAGRYSFLEGERLEARVTDELEQERSKTMGGIVLSLSLSEEVRYPSDDPDLIVSAANLPATTSFSIELVGDYSANPLIDRSAVRLSAGLRGVTGTVTSQDRQFVDAVKMRLDKLLIKTRPPHRLIASHFISWMFVPVTAWLLYNAVVALVQRFTDDSWLSVIIGGSAYVVYLVAGLVLLFTWWYKQFPKLEIYANSGASRAARATKRVGGIIAWVAGVIVLPVVLSLVIPPAQG